MSKTTAIIACSCPNENQDKIYGKGKRVFNKKTKSSNAVSTTFSCSVCGSTKTVATKDI